MLIARGIIALKYEVYGTLGHFEKVRELILECKSTLTGEKIEVHSSTWSALFLQLTTMDVTLVFQATNTHWSFAAKVCVGSRI